MLDSFLATGQKKEYGQKILSNVARSMASKDDKDRPRGYGMLEMVSIIHLTELPKGRLYLLGFRDDSPNYSWRSIGIDKRQQSGLDHLQIRASKDPNKQ